MKGRGHDANVCVPGHEKGREYASRPFPDCSGTFISLRTSRRGTRGSGGERDENLIDEELLETEIPLDDRIPDAAHEDGENDRPVYDEEGYRHDPGGE